MANKKLNSIKWPNLPDDTYYLDADKVVFDNSEEYAEGSVGKALQHKAEIDGYYSDMTVGDAEQLVSTVFTEDDTPYNFRTSGGSIDIGDREYDEIVGGTIAWNQLFSVVGNKTVGGVTITDNQDGSFTLNGNVTTRTQLYSQNVRNRVFTAGEKLLFQAIPMSGTVTGGTTMFCHIYKSDESGSIYPGVQFTDGDGNYVRSAGIAEVSATGSASYIAFDCNDLVDTTFTNYRIKIQAFSLTQMFGSTIADYIYNLEVGSAGAGVGFFKKLFPKPYYAYNAGELMSVNAVEHSMVGFNAWDEEWEEGLYNGGTGLPNPVSGRIRSKSANPIEVFPNTNYYVPASVSQICWYDMDDNFISSVGNPTASVATSPSNARYLRFHCSASYGSTYKNDICINLSWDGERNGEYEPYVKRSYPLGDVELRGIPKLDASNNLYYDGDTYEADGTVTRKYGDVDLGTLTWAKSSSGNNFYATLTGNYAYGTAVGMACAKYKYAGSRSASPYYADDKEFTYNERGGVNSPSEIYIHDEAYTSASAFKTAMSGVHLVYELATPTTEEAEPYNSVQWVDDFGTEEYVDGKAQSGLRDVAVPVGHNTKYVPNLRAKVETAPDSPDADGDYLMRHSNGGNAYVSLASSTTIQNIIARLEALEGDA